VIISATILALALGTIIGTIQAIRAIIKARKKNRQAFKQFQDFEKNHPPH